MSFIGELHIIDYEYIPNIWIFNNPTKTATFLAIGFDFISLKFSFQATNLSQAILNKLLR